MSEAAENSVLRKMTAANRADVGLSAMSAHKALRYSLAKSGDDCLSADVNVLEVGVTTLVPDNLGKDLPDPALFIRLEGANGAVGLAVACVQVVGAAVEAKTIGRIQNAAAAERKPTKTDASLITGFLDASLLGFGILAGDCTPPLPVDGFTSAGAVADVRTAQMALADEVHLHFNISLDIDSGSKIGTLHFIVPAKRTTDAGAKKANKDWQGTLEKAVLGTSARMEAVLCKPKLSLAELTKLSVGDVLPLQGASVDGLSLVGTDGSRVIKARLGRSGPVRAVRLQIGPPSKPVVSPGNGIMPLTMEPPAPDPLANANPVPTPDLNEPAPIEAAAVGGGPDPMPAATDLPALDVPIDAPAPMAMGGLPELPPLG